MDACFVLFLCFMSTCVCVCLQVQGPLRSALWPGASGLPYHCTPPVCVPAVFGGLAVWLHNKYIYIYNQEHIKKYIYLLPKEFWFLVFGL